jgi:GntR family transcriptional regulator, rspAB operon transcriptional repressor
LKLVKISNERVGDMVYQMLRQSILDQTFRPGERLQLDQLAAKLGVSATPIKDAVNRLAQEGLVDLHARKGTFVSLISVDDLAETLEIRCALECLAAAKAAKTATPEDIQEFAEMVAQMDVPIEDEHQRASHEQINLTFHQKLMELSRNRKLIKLYKSLNAHITVARVHYASQAWRERLVQEAREHHLILSALERRDGPGLTEALRSHIEGASQALIDDIRRNRANS